MTPVAVMALRFLATLGILAIGPAIAFDLLQRAGLLAPSTSVTQHVESSMLVFVLACGVVAAFAAWQSPGIPWRPARAGFVVASYVPFVLAWALVLVGYLAAARALGVAVVPQPQLEYLAAADPARPGFWVVVAGITVAAPLAEEIVFRGYLQQAFATRMRPAVAIALTAAAFGAVHTLPYALPVGLLGAFFGWLAHRSGSLLPAVLAHAVHNTTTVLVTVVWPDSLTLLYPR